MEHEDDTICSPAALTDLPRVFQNRAHAGRFLARLIADEIGLDTVVCAIPPGGVLVGGRIARYHRLPLEAAVTADIRAPWDDGPVFGAVAWDGNVQLDQHLLADLALSRVELRAAIAAAFVSLGRAAEELRADRPPPLVHERPVVLVSDGLSSVHAVVAATAALRNAGAARVALALPTALRRDLQRLAAEVDRTYCANVHVSCTFRLDGAYERVEDAASLRAAALLTAGSGNSRNQDPQALTDRREVSEPLPSSVVAAVGRRPAGL
jgi:putative phosphoribosyl transferase